MRTFPPRQLHLVTSFASILATLAATPSWAQSQEVYSQRDVAMRWGLTPAQAREVYRRIDQERRIFVKTARANGINENAFVSVAKALGLQNPKLPVGDLLQKMLDRISTLKEIEENFSEISNYASDLEASDTNKRVQQLTANALSAYERGDLDRAYELLNELRALARTDLSRAFAAWSGSMEISISLASFAGDLETVDRLVIENEREIQNQVKAYDVQLWNNRLLQALAWQNQGLAKSDAPLLEKTIALYTDLVIPLATKVGDRKILARTYNDLSVAYQSLGEISGDSKHYNSAIAVLESAIALLVPDKDIAQWVIVKNNLGSTLRSLSARQVDQSLAIRSIEHYRDVLDKNHSFDYMTITTFSNNYSVALMQAGQFNINPSYLREAEQLLETILLQVVESGDNRIRGAIQGNLGVIKLTLGERTGDATLLTEAKNILTEAIKLEDYPRSSVKTSYEKYNLAKANFALSALSGNVEETFAAERLADQLVEDLKDYEFIRRLSAIDWFERPNKIRPGIALLGYRPFRRSYSLISERNRSS